MVELWLEIDGYEGIYHVSNFGRVKSFASVKFKTGRIMKQRLNEKGYLRISLNLNKQVRTFRVHRLVAIAFIRNTNSKSSINHINGIKTDNNFKNLEWVTIVENNSHALQIGLIKVGEQSKVSKLNDIEAYKIKFDLPHFSNRQAAKLFNISSTQVSRIRLGKNWSHLKRIH